jgi:hypothetical protein
MILLNKKIEVDGKIEILGKSVKSNQQKVINILKKMYD